MPTAVPARSTGEPEAPAPRRPGRSPALSSGAARAAVRIGAFALCQAAVMAGAGLLITGPGHGRWPLTVEDAVNESLEGARTSALTTASTVASAFGDTSTVVGITLVSCLLLVLVPRLPCGAKRSSWRPGSRSSRRSSS